MKNIFTSRMILAVVFILWMTAVSFAQNEDKGFSFQGYARDFSGAAYSSQELTVKFSIYPEGEADEFVEEQAVETDPYGVFQAVIGETLPVPFSALEFGNKKYFLRVEVKAPGDDFVEISNAELLAVPYAKSSETAQNGVPAGTLLPFAGLANNIPDGYLACDGSLVRADDYPALYAAIGDLWGGDGTNFNLPDFRGRFMRGWDDGEGNDPDAATRTALYAGGATGDQVGTYQTDTLAAHTATTDNTGNHSHSWSYPYSTDEDGNGTSRMLLDDGGGSQGTFSRTTNSTGAHSHTVTATGGAETRPENATVLYIIKY